MRIPKFILGALLSVLIGVSGWAGRQLLEVRDRVTRIEASIQVLLPATRTAGAVSTTNHLAQIIQ